MISPREKARILEQAVDWLMRDQQQPLTADELEQLEQWRQQSAFHARAWNKVLELQGKFRTIPPHLAMPVLQDRHPVAASWKKYLLVLGCLPVLWGIYYANQQQQWLADYRSTTGQRKTVHLPDGGQILMNANSAIDIDYSQKQRMVVLRKGEIWIETHHDRLNRPFYIKTRQGTAQALGTRYLVKMRPHIVLVAVEHGAVKISTGLGHQEKILNAGQQAYFDKNRIQHTEQLNISRLAWTRGFLMVNDMPLSEFIRRLQPYQTGFIRLDPALQDLKVSGTYPIDDLPKVYNMLASTHHLSIRSYAGGYWRSIEKKKD